MDRQSRFIPARAGNTVPGTETHGVPPVHPRSRGEHGSVAPIRPVPVDRFIPARAGNTPHPPADPERYRFIPARAGNTACARRVANVGAGSSPLARGTQARSARTVHPRSRGEPALSCRAFLRPVHPRSRGEHAGLLRCAAGIRSVHPRSRGEHFRELDCSERFAKNGSSPLARGTRLRRLPSWDGYYLGSSPLARGTLFPQDIDSKGVSERQKPHQLWSPDSGEKATARSRRVAPRLWLVHRRSVAARNARA